MIQQFVQNLSDKELKQAFDEITEWKYKTAVLKDGIVRETHRQYKEKYGETELYLIEDALLYEMARRFVEKVKDDKSIEEITDFLSNLGKVTVKKSSVTGKYYVTIDNVEVKEWRGSSTLTAIVVHMDTPEEAIRAYYEKLISYPVIVVDAFGCNRKEYTISNGKIVPLD
jgi:predicted hydrocarbon binding protein